jgi:hypothetical protein
VFEYLDQKLLYLSSASKGKEASNCGGIFAKLGSADHSAFFFRPRLMNGLSPKLSASSLTKSD